MIEVPQSGTPPHGDKTFCLQHVQLSVVTANWIAASSVCCSLSISAIYLWRLLHRRDNPATLASDENTAHNLGPQGSSCPLE
eukprot:6456117-Amphidinium_carterae.4